MRELLGVTLLVMQTTLFLPILRHAYRTRSAEGIALTSEAFWLVAGAGWIAYGLATSNTVLALSGTVASLGCLALLLLVGRGEAGLRRALLLSGLLALALGASALGGVTGLGLALAVAGAVQFGPQVFVSLRLLSHRARARGVARWGAFGRVFYTAAWGVFGIFPLWAGGGTVDLPLAAWGFTGAVAFALQFVTTVVGDHSEPTPILSPMELSEELEELA